MVKAKFRKRFVLNADGSMPSGLKLPPPAPKAKKAKAEVIKEIGRAHV